MRSKNYKGRCVKQNLPKFSSVCKTYDDVQLAYGFSKIEKPMIDVIDFADEANEITGIKVDPFTDSIFIPRKMFKFLRVTGVTYRQE